jgi:hypothetical protein
MKIHNLCWVAFLTASTAFAGDSRMRVIGNPPLLLEPVSSFGAASTGDWLYVYSGHIGRTHEHSRDNLWLGFARLNLLDGRTWETLPPGRPLQGLAFVAHGSELALVGGLSARNAKDEPADLYSVDEVAAFDPLTRAWRSLPPLPEPRSSHDAVVVGDALYVMAAGISKATSNSGTGRHG